MPGVPTHDPTLLHVALCHPSDVGRGALATPMPARQAPKSANSAGGGGGGGEGEGEGVGEGEGDGVSNDGATSTAMTPPDATRPMPLAEFLLRHLVVMLRSALRHPRRSGHYFALLAALARMHALEQTPSGSPKVALSSVRSSALLGSSPMREEYFLARSQQTESQGVSGALPGERCHLPVCVV